MQSFLCSRHVCAVVKMFVIIYTPPTTQNLLDLFLPQQGPCICR